MVTNYCLRMRDGLALSFFFEADKCFFLKYQSVIFKIETWVFAIGIRLHLPSWTLLNPWRGILPPPDMPAATEAVEVRPSAPELKIHSFSDSLLNHRLHFQVIGLRGSFFLWVGTDPGEIEVKSPARDFPYSTMLSRCYRPGDRRTCDI